MKVQQAADYYINYYKANSKKNTIRNQVFILSRFLDEFGDRKITSISSDEILSFLNRLTRGQKQTTKRIRYANLTHYVPWHIMSKIILRHSNLSTTQRYLGKISDVEALRWIENLHG